MLVPPAEDTRAQYITQPNVEALTALYERMIRESAQSIATQREKIGSAPKVSPRTRVELIKAEVAGMRVYQLMSGLQARDGGAQRGSYEDYIASLEAEQ